MKLILTLLAAAFPAAAAAQVSAPTLDLVQELSVSAARTQDLSAARSEAARPFVQPPGHQPGHPGNGHHVNPPQPAHPQHPAHPAHPVTPSHPQPPQAHPHYPPPPPYHPPQGPGWHPGPNPYHPPHPYNPPGYYPPQGPSHQTTTPVVHHPANRSTWAIVGVVLLTVLLVVILL